MHSKLGVGIWRIVTSNKMVEMTRLAEEPGLKRTQPLAAVRETIEICHALFTGQTITYQGEIFSTENIWLHFESRANLPIYDVTREDKMLVTLPALPMRLCQG